MCGNVYFWHLFLFLVLQNIVVYASHTYCVGLDEFSITVLQHASVEFSPTIVGFFTS